MSRTAILSVRVISDTKAAQKGAQDTANAWDKFEKKLDRASMYAGIAGGGLIALGKKATDSASKLQQTSGAVQSVFKKDAAAITDFAKTAWESVGLSQSETQEMATILGAQLKNLGVPMEEIAGKTIDLTKLGADLAATYGGTTADAVGALSSLLRGERDPIERYGVGIKQADINAEKMALGLDGLTGAAGKQAEIQATLSLLTKQTADAQGQAAREFDTVEAATQRANAAWENSMATISTALLPLVAELAEHLAGAAQWVQQNDQLVRQLAAGVGVASVSILGLNAGIKAYKFGATVFNGVSKAGSAAASVIGRFASGMRNANAAQSVFSGTAGTLGGKVATAATALKNGAIAAGRWAVQTTVLTAKLVAQKVAQIAIATASKAAAAAQWLWNAATNANPLMLIITGIVALIVLLIANWDTVKAVAVAVWDAISTAAQWFWDNVLVPIGEWLATTFGPYWEATKLIAVAVWDAISTAAKWLWETILVPIGEWIAATFVAHWEALKLVATAVWDGISAAAKWLWETILMPIGEWIATEFTSKWEAFKLGATIVWSSITSVAKQFWDGVLVPIGQWIASTFTACWNQLKTAATAVWNGIKQAGSSVWSWLKQLGTWISSTFTGAWTKVRDIGKAALDALIAPVQSLIQWVKEAIDWVGNLFSKGGDLLGKVFGFTAPVTVGAELTAASGLHAGLAPAIAGSRSSGPVVQQVINVTIDAPNYAGDRAEFARTVRDALQQINLKDSRIARI